MNQLIIILLLIILFLLFSKNNQYEKFTNDIPIDWKDLAEKECDTLKNEIKQVDLLLESCKLNYENNNQQLLINDSLVCRDANEMYINNDRETNLWCNIAQGQPPKEEIFIGTSLKNIETDTYNIDNNIKTEINTINNLYIKLDAPFKEGSDNKHHYALIN